MNIVHDEAQQRFTITTEAGEAVVDYERNGQHVNFTHTYVPPEMRGRGIAEALVRRALQWAKDQGLEIEASCWYVAKFLQAGSRRS